jgi:hypothetical protein
MGRGWKPNRRSMMHRSKGGVQSEISIWGNRIFDSRSVQCHADTSWIDGGADVLDRRRRACTTARGWIDGDELDRHWAKADGGAVEEG